MTLPQSAINKVIEVLPKAVTPDIIYLFGSFANGTTHPKSDIDIAYLSNSTITPYERFSLAQKLASSLNRDVDLIDLNAASTVFQSQIISNGQPIYCVNDVRKAEFEMLVLKKYAKLNEERKIILNRIEESGQIYE
ncbi:nucleotidyltransferase domain-containing protein [Cytobacillus sp. FJAT-54145]|uniref:Nucleotidyltransferase domain-containing protein n=1 Tax=Cytobacillus spartinae TaxID=3299023 RepID=A0ABW6KDB5_9BACI